AAKTSEPLRAAVTGENAELYFGLAEAGGLAGDSNRTAQSQFAAATERKSINGAYGRLTHRFEKAEDALARKRKFLAAHWSLLCEFADVGAGDECFFSGPRKDNHAGARIVACV